MCNKFGVDSSSLFLLERGHSDTHTQQTHTHKLTDATDHPISCIGYTTVTMCAIQLAWDSSWRLYCNPSHWTRFIGWLTVVNMIVLSTFSCHSSMSTNCLTLPPRLIAVHEACCSSSLFWAWRISRYGSFKYEEFPSMILSVIILRHLIHVCWELSISNSLVLDCNVNLSEKFLHMQVNC